MAQRHCLKVRYVRTHVEASGQKQSLGTLHKAVALTIDLAGHSGLRIKWNRELVGLAQFMLTNCRSKVRVVHLNTYPRTAMKRIVSRTLLWEN